MAERSENVLAWNVPNVVTIWLMIALLWVIFGVVSHAFRGKKTTAGLKTDDNGNIAGG